MSRKTKATTDTMFREITAKQIQTMGARPEGAALVIEHGTALLNREALQERVNSLHAERGPLVVKAREVRMHHGVTSPQFARAWFDVERLTADLVEAEAALAKAGPERFEETVCAVANHLCQGIELLPSSWMATECSIFAAKLHDMLLSIKDGTAATSAPEKAWRDATVELPDDEITVMLRLVSDGDEPVAVGHHADAAWWINGADTAALGLDVIGWMHLHEATAILDAAARKAVRHG